MVLLQKGLGVSEKSRQGAQSFIPSPAVPHYRWRRRAACGPVRAQDTRVPSDLKELAGKRTTWGPGKSGCAPRAQRVGSTDVAQLCLATSRAGRRQGPDALVSGTGGVLSTTE